MTSKAKAPETRAPDQDAIALLIADHRHVAKLFADFKNLKDEGSDEEKASVVRQICQELLVHSSIEEEIFYPAVRRAIEDDDLMDQALVEQTGAKDLIAQLQAAEPDDDLYDAKVIVLGEQIDHHVMEEEGNMFPQARGAGVDIETIGSEMLARKAELLANPDAAVQPANEDDGFDVEEDEDQDAEDDEASGPSKAARPPGKGRPKTTPAKKARQAPKKRKR
jgi:hemerythrin superfamily protein